MPILPECLSSLNDRPVRTDGEFVVYWMQASQRTRDNRALCYAVAKADALHIPLIVFFRLLNTYPEANRRHFTFLTEGLGAIAKNLHAKNIRFLVSCENDPTHIPLSELARRASLVVTDCGYTRFQKAWRETEARRIPCALYQVESNVVVPVETASPKEEYSAATFRKKITPLLAEFLAPVSLQKPIVSSLHFSFPSLNLSHAIKLPPTLHNVSPSPVFHGGEDEARRRLDTFLEHRFSNFAHDRNRPELDAVSHLSPFLHFGHIAPTTILAEAKKRFGTQNENYQTLLEELVVRRELACNFTWYNPRYDTFDTLPDWAKKTLEQHADDPREFLSNRETFERAQTHDPYWNAAQHELVRTGLIHGYMRMYWGKKILEWSKTPREAFDTALFLNNRYALDGRDPNSFAGVAWCFGKHDRPWAERPVFGMVRFMNARGLERKFDMPAYLARVYAERP